MEKEEDKLNFIFHSRPRISHIQLSFGSFFFFFPIAEQFIGFMPRQM